MTTVEEDKQLLVDIQAQVVVVNSGVDNLLAQVAALNAELAASGGAVTQADLDAIGASAQAIKDSLTGIVAKEPTAV